MARGSFSLGLFRGIGYCQLSQFYFSYCLDNIPVCFCYIFQLSAVIIVYKQLPVFVKKRLLFAHESPWKLSWFLLIFPVGFVRLNTLFSILTFSKILVPFLPRYEFLNADDWVSLGFLLIGKTCRRYVKWTLWREITGNYLQNLKGGNRTHAFNRF